MTLILGRAVKRWRETAVAGGHSEEVAVHGWRRVHTVRLVIWSICWGSGIVAVGHFVLGQPVLYLSVALVLVCVFALVNGISLGISDSNPISSAFVVSIVILAAIGLKDPAVGLMIRPQMKRQKEHKAMIDALAKGDEVVTSGGVLGKVSKMGDTFVGLEVADGVEIQIQRSAVVQVMPKGTVK